MIGHPHSVKERLQKKGGNFYLLKFHASLLIDDDVVDKASAYNILGKIKRKAGAQSIFVLF